MAMAWGCPAPIEPKWLRNELQAVVCTSVHAMTQNTSKAAVTTHGKQHTCETSDMQVRLASSRHATARAL